MENDALMTQIMSLKSAPLEELKAKYREVFGQGQIIEVRVLEGKFEYKGKIYRSLTAIAKEITGAHWNGFGFFNL